MKISIVFIIIIGIFALLLVNKLVMSKEVGDNINSKSDKSENLKEAIFAGGCFWCVEAGFEDTDGVVEAISGYTGGQTPNPTYEQISSGQTEHLEAVKVIYDSNKISYEELVEVFWKFIDPTDDTGQFVDKGPQYRTAIFYKTPEEKQIAEDSKEKLANSKIFEKPIITKILPSKEFYEAEEYHQDYSKKRTLAYKIYEKGSGREKFKKVWEK